MLSQGWNFPETASGPIIAARAGFNCPKAPRLVSKDAWPATALQELLVYDKPITGLRSRT